eukprot:GFUD01017109.1.p1 GENE.GFUD01017109.1~~GFUD01017109.1.p1  ORF type:complete len:631 (+),score=178.18 GFUD01017109.1:60-1952(+)
MLLHLTIALHTIVVTSLADSPPTPPTTPVTIHTTPTTPPHQHVVDRVPRPFTITANSSIRISSKITENDNFLVFEAHCRASAVLMSFVADPNTNYVNSTSPALIYMNDMAMGIRDPGVYIINPHPYQVVVLAMVKAYTATDPVPGYCMTVNSKGGVWPKPFLILDWNSALIRLNFSRASHLGTSLECNDLHSVQYKVYQRYLSRDGWGEGTRDQQFHEALKTFSEIEDIEKWGQSVTSLGAHVDRLVFASYSPTGSLYAVIAVQGNGSSVYALGHTYGCDVDPLTGVCPDTAHTVTKVVCAINIFTGLLMAFAGHRFFMASQFLFGFYTGSVVGYILLSITFSPDFVEIFSLTTLCGLTMAILVSGLWFFLGIPVLSVLLPTLEVGVMVASCILFLPQMNIPSLTTDLYYWLVFLCLILAMPVILLAFTQKASILSCVIVGSTSLTLPIDYFLGTGLRFIFINVVRRATHPRFYLALIQPSLQMEDLMVVACWLAVSAAALLTQLLVERRRPPFPPAPFQQWRWRREVNMEGEEGETAPLLSDDESLGRAEPVASPVVGYILGHRPVTGIPQASPAIVRGEVQVQGRGRAGGVPGNSSGRVRDIFKPPSLEDRPAYQYSPRQGEEWVATT